METSSRGWFYSSSLPLTSKTRGVTPSAAILLSSTPHFPATARLPAREGQWQPFEFDGRAGDFAEAYGVLL